MVACPATLESTAARPLNHPCQEPVHCAPVSFPDLDHRKQDSCFSWVRSRCGQEPLSPLGEGEGSHVPWATSQACAGRRIMNSPNNCEVSNCLPGLERGEKETRRRDFFSPRQTTDSQLIEARYARPGGPFCPQHL